MFLIFASGALAGSAMSLLKDAPAKLSIGGSSALFAMLAALLVMSFHISEPAKKTRIQFAGLTLLLLGLLPIPHVIGAVAADFSAPIGGVAIGGLIGLLLLLTWPADAARPGFRKLAAIFASVAALSFMSAAYAVSFHYPQYAKSGLFIPPAQYPQDPSEFRARANELFAQYPRDPRAHLIAGRAGLLRGDRVGAEYEFRAAMTLINDQTAQQFPPLENTIRAWLATTLLDQGRRMEAQSIAKEACSAKGAAAASADIAAILLKSGLCTISHR
jgi:hypothetical protein